LKTELSEDEIKLMDEVRKEWIDYFFSLKFNVNKAKAIVRFLYKISDLEQPKAIIVLDSPMACQIGTPYAVRLIEEILKVSDMGNQVRSQVMRQVESQVGSQVERQVESQVRRQVWNQVGSQVWDQVWNQVGSQVGSQVMRQVESQVERQVESQVERQVRRQVMRQVESQVWNQVERQVREQVGSQVGSQVERQVESQVRRQVWNQVGSQVWDQVWNQVESQVWNQVESQVWNQVESQVWDQVESQVWDQVRRQVRSQVESQETKYYEISYYGDVWSYGWVSFYDFFNRIGIVSHKLFDEFVKKLKANIIYMIQLSGVCIISRMPTHIDRDENGRPHSMERPAIEFKDGYSQHYVGGVFFNPELFNNAFIDCSLTAKDILNITNAEQRVVLIKHYGYDFICDELGSKTIDSYDGISQVTGKPVHYDLIDFELDGTNHRFVKVEDHSVHKVVTLGVPVEDGTETCLGAIAWTFGMTEEEYKPELES